MRSYKVIKRTRFSEQDIKTIIESTEPIRIDIAIGKNNVVFKDVTFVALDMIKSTFKSSISFINCKFESTVNLTNVNATNEISFHGCSFNEGLNIFDCSAKNISISVSSLNGNVILDSTECKKISIQKVNCSILRVLSSVKSTKVNEVDIKDTVVKDLINLEELHNTKGILLDTVSANVIRCNALMLTFAAEAIFTSISCSDLKFENIRLESGCKIKVSQSQVKNLFYSNINFTEDCKVLLDSNLIEGKLFIQNCIYNNCTIDFATSEITHLSLDPELLRFMNDSSVSTSIISKDMSIGSKIEVLKKLKNKFASENLYESEDIVFFKMKNEEYKNFLVKTENIFTKIKYLLFYVFGRYLFGWGVKLFQPLVTSIITVLLFSVIYYFVYDLKISTNRIGFLQVEYTGVIASVLTSTVTFFGQYTDIETELALSAALHISEFILGVVFITVLVGIFIRKLVR